MKILYIAPLPPPINGHSLASQVLLDELSAHHEVTVVNCRKESFGEGIDSTKRISEVCAILTRVWKHRHRNDVIYLTIAQSFAGNVKDLLTYLLCFRQLHRFYIHLHGGSIKEQLWNHHPILYRLNKFFISRLAGVVVLGESHRKTFEEMVDRERIHVVPNFSEGHLFSSVEEINHKFSSTSPLRLLYLSNMKTKKGYGDVLEAFLSLSDNQKRLIEVDFAGRFGSESEENEFLHRIEGFPQIRYHGVVEGDQKKALLGQAHLFCLPSSYLEGQPISILEAYAAGCVVITTGQSGIRDIFTDDVNGFEISERSPLLVRDAIEHALTNLNRLSSIALHNRELADQKYRTETYGAALLGILESGNTA